MKLSKTERRILACGRSRKGAWIEISPEARVDDVLDVAPARERGLKCFLCCGEYGDLNVAPVRERGLKFLSMRKKYKRAGSLP